MNLQVIASPGDEIVWVNGPLPGAVHDQRVITGTRILRLGTQPLLNRAPATLLTAEANAHRHRAAAATQPAAS
jgi:hypothetical protein